MKDAKHIFSSSLKLESLSIAKTESRFIFLQRKYDLCSRGQESCWCAFRKNYLLSLMNETFCSIRKMKTWFLNLFHTTGLLYIPWIYQYTRGFLASGMKWVNMTIIIWKSRFSNKMLLTAMGTLFLITLGSL